MSNAIKINNLSKQYGNHVALKNFSLEIKKGEIYGIVGKNGAGKSTLLKLICGVTMPTEGDIEIFDSKDLIRQRKEIGAIIENPVFFGGLSAQDNLRYFAYQRGFENKNFIEKTLNMVGLDCNDKRAIKTYSLGMKQRFSLGLSLFFNPKLLILDEPINAVDPEGIVEIRNLLLKLNKEKGITIIISSHILSELKNMATKIIIIDKGNLIKEVDIEEISSKFDSHIELFVSDIDRTAALLGASLGIANIEKKQNKIIINKSSNLNINEMLKLLIHEDIEIFEIRRNETELEDYYLQTINE